MDITSHEIIHHTDNGLALHSFLAMPTNIDGVLPAVLVAPEWWGITEHPKSVAKKLAQAGYIALAMDVYGDGKVTTEASQANTWMTDLLNNMDVLVEHATMAYEVVLSLPQVNSDKLAAVGYCFGGKIVLDMARSGLDLNAVATFHGNPTPIFPAKSDTFKAEVLFAHGELDSMVPMEAVEAFKQEMTQAHVTHQVDIYQGAKHGFTNPVVDQRAADNGIDLQYNQQAADASWERMLTFFERTLA